MPTIVLTTFARRDASERELAAESASQSAAKMGQRAGLARSESQGRCVPCRGLLRAHVHGAKLEALIALQRLAAKRGGIVWAGPNWLTKIGICSIRHARRIFSGLVNDGWLIETEWHGRRAFQVLAHAEWAAATGNCDATEDILSAKGGHFVRSGGTRSHLNPLSGKDFQSVRSASEDQEVQDQSITSYCQPSEFLKNNIAAKIEATNSSWQSYLAEESENSRSTLRKKFSWVCRVLDFDAENDASLDWEFPLTMIESYKEHRESLRSGALTRGVFASKVIDTCERNGILWPPAFTELRDRLRQIERHSEVNSTLEAANANRSHR